MKYIGDFVEKWCPLPRGIYDYQHDARRRAKEQMEKELREVMEANKNGDLPTSRLYEVPECAGYR